MSTGQCPPGFSSRVPEWGPRVSWTVVAALRGQAQQRGSDPFVSVDGAEWVTFADLLERAERTARGLAGVGVRDRDRVAVMVPTCEAALDIWLGIALLGASEVALNIAYRGHTLEHALNLGATPIVIIDQQFLPQLVAVREGLPHLRTVVVLGSSGGIAMPGVEVVELAELPTAAIDFPVVDHRHETSVLFTSGTSGPAKGVMVPHGQAFAVAKQTGAALRLTPDDTMFGFTPLFHMGGKHSLVLTALVNGTRLILDSVFDPDGWLERARMTGATVGMGHGPLLEMIHATPSRSDDAVNPLRAVGACPLPAAIAESFEQRFGVRGVETWGMTEAPVPVWSVIDEPLRVGVAGRVLTDLYDVVITDFDTDVPVPTGQAGEITVRSHEPWLMMQGYLNMPEQTVKAWRNLRFHTGDAGFMDDEGYLHFLDRMGDRIRRRAENISAYDIEVVAMDYLGVTEAAAIGVPSALSGDDDIALYVVAPEGPPETLQLFTHLVDHLPHYMVPRYIAVVSSLPRTPTNKVRKQALRDRTLQGVWDYNSSAVSIREVRSRA